MASTIRSIQSEWIPFRREFERNPLRSSIHEICNPSGIDNCSSGPGTGGVASLDHRLIADVPPARQSPTIQTKNIVRFFTQQLDFKGDNDFGRLGYRRPRLRSAGVAFRNPQERGCDDGR